MSERPPASIPRLELPPEEKDTQSREDSPSRKNQSANLEQAGDKPAAKTDPSSTRSATSSVSQSSLPVAAASQKMMSVSNPNLASIDATLDSTRDRRRQSSQSSPSWPTSPRLKSPPPSTVRMVATRRSDAEHSQPNTAVKRLGSASTPELGTTPQVHHDNQKDSNVSQSSLRASGRGASAQATGLETVVEGSAPSTPTMGPVNGASDESRIETSTLDLALEATGDAIQTRADTPSTVESSSRLNVERPEATSVSAPTSRATSNTRPAGGNLAKRSFTSLTGSNKKPTVEPLRSMTVETEPVAATSQLLPERGRDASSVKTKPSTETIRPKKEKKKPTRRAPSLHAGTGTTKADIFEAKIASAVDEADSSDSDETFVYESNPPEAPRQSRHHSRTPSATSLASQIDHYAARSKHGVRTGSNAIPGKKSMKFSSGGHGTQHEGDAAAGEGGRGSTRAHGSTSRHHHIGRHGRNGHTSLFDHDSPFTQANRANPPRTPVSASNRHSRPSSPRHSNNKFFTARKNISGGYDTYDDAADDERAPLIGSTRVNRSRHGRRPPPNFRPLDFTEQLEPRCWPRFSGCILLVILLALVLIGIATFVVALSRPLIDVEVNRIANVIASEQLLLLDLRVQATNPNLFAITVNDLDVSLFAQSPYVGTARQWRENHPHARRGPIEGRRQEFLLAQKRAIWFPPLHQDDGVDEGTDPVEEEPGTQKLLLGQVNEFESALVFDASPLRHHTSSSVGLIRLAKPGNATVGGIERWERVLPHAFDLLIRGVIKYQLPLSSHTRTAKISFRYKVEPDKGGDDDGGGDNNGTTTYTGRR